jgi:nucleoid DNA-binding protein
MKREQLARELARESGLPAAAARDQVDELVHKIVGKLRKGQPVRLPGIGKLLSPSGRRGGR